MDHDHSQHHMHHQPVVNVTSTVAPSIHDHHDHGSMDHGSMDHGSMDHGSMDHGMDHSNTAGAAVNHAMHHMMEMAVSTQLQRVLSKTQLFLLVPRRLRWNNSVQTMVDKQCIWSDLVDAGDFPARRLLRSPKILPRELILEIIQFITVPSCERSGEERNSWNRWFSSRPVS